MPLAARVDILRAPPEWVGDSHTARRLIDLSSRPDYPGPPSLILLRAFSGVLWPNGRGSALTSSSNEPLTPVNHRQQFVDMRSQAPIELAASAASETTVHGPCSRVAERSDGLAYRGGVPRTGVRGQPPRRRTANLTISHAPKTLRMGSNGVLTSIQGTDSLPVISGTNHAVPGGFALGVGASGTC